VGEKIRGPAAPGAPRDHALGRSRGGWGTKLSPVTDGRGLPLAAALPAGQASDRTVAPALLETIRIGGRPGAPRRYPARRAADRSYSFRPVRDWCRRPRVAAVVPTRRDQVHANRRLRRPFDARRYRQRNAIERTVGHLKEQRRIATRAEKLATRYLAMVTLGMIRLILRRAVRNSA
jgi:transposase